MHATVPLPLVAASEATPAHVAGERLLSGVRAHVSGEMVAAAEATQAHAALEGLVSGVNAHVAIELVGAGKATLAVLNRAGEWLLAGRAFPSARFASLHERVGGEKRVQRVGERGRCAAESWERDAPIKAVFMGSCCCCGNLEVR